MLSVGGAAQTSTTTKGDTKPVQKQPVPAATTKTKVLIVPFSPRMYMSEIDMSINRETSMNYRQIREGFRVGLNKAIAQEFRKTCTVVSLLDDTVKMKKDLDYVYEVTSCSYDPVGTATKQQAAPKKDTSKNPPKTATGVKKGQLAVETNDQEKFMNTLILSPNLLTYFKKKYGADYIVFVNELDLKNELGEDPYNMSGSDDYRRSASAHYTVVATATGKRIAAGKAKSFFSAKTNKPQKIIDGQFSSISKTIFEKFEAGRKL
ncbi:MAG: hypothetical protein FD123_45 [Bacteroidetes bacterium]|nr:MAG: hypothetical protein FD123_45 [Bacteroidota bacterium]